MIDLIFKFLLIITLVLVFLQDVKDRLVYWFLYPIIGIFALSIQVNNIGFISAGINSLINLLFISIILAVVFGYSNFIIKKKFINESMGLGDILLFIFLCFTFSTPSFIVLFVFSLIFSLMLHLYFKGKSSHDNVPLAGYIGIFFAAIYFISFFTVPKYLFA